jgi:hypothetical protein
MRTWQLGIGHNLNALQEENQSRPRRRMVNVCLMDLLVKGL